MHIACRLPFPFFCTYEACQRLWKHEYTFSTWRALFSMKAVPIWVRKVFHKQLPKFHKQLFVEMHIPTIAQQHCAWRHWSTVLQCSFPYVYSLVEQMNPNHSHTPMQLMFPGFPLKWQNQKHVEMVNFSSVGRCKEYQLGLGGKGRYSSHGL